MFLRKTVFVVGTIVGGLAAGCAPTRTEVVSASAQAARAPIFKLVVFGANMTADYRYAIEDGLVRDLRARGVDARAAHAIFATSPAEQTDARGAVVAQGYEAVLRVTLAQIERAELFDAEEGTRPSPSSVWNLQASLWDLGEDRLAWSADTRTANPVGPNDLAASVAGAILPALTRAHLILPVRADGG